MAFFPEEKSSGGLFGGIFGQGDFTIDQNATPEMIKAKRAQIAALMPQYGRAKYVGEGLGQLFSGIATGRKNKALDKFEGERSAEAAEAFNRLMSGGNGGGGPLSVLGMREGGSYTAPAPQNPNDAMFPTGQEGPSPEGNIDPASGLNMGQEVGGGYRESLIGTESGGNWAAQNSEVGAGGKPGHFGRVQFGQARLQDAMNAGAIPQGVTPQQFMASPELQMAAEDWHFADLENQLGDLVGAQVGGQTLDMGALVAMGHLGGANGARRYVETGGRYNPADSFGTSLSDYANTHGGNSFAPGPGTQVAQAGGGPALNDLMMAAQNPWLTPAQRGVINTQIQQQQRQQQMQQQQQMQREQFLWEQQNKPPQTSVVKGVGLINSQTGEVINDFGGASSTADPATVQSSVVLDDGTSVLVMNDGNRRVLSPTGEAVQGQDAADAIRAAREYTVANQQDVYNARRSGTLGADIDLGAAAAGAEDLGKASIAAGVSAWEDYGKLQSSIGTIGEAITAIDNGADSGMIAKYLPNVTEASASLNNAMDRMGLDVVGSVTFGALSEGELRLAMNTAVPRDLSPPELRSWLLKKQAAQQKAADMLSDAAQYLTRPGNTINSWIEKNKEAKQVAPQERAQPETLTPQQPAPGSAAPVKIDASSIPSMSDPELRSYLLNTPGDQIPDDVWAAIEARTKP